MSRRTIITVVISIVCACVGVVVYYNIDPAQSVFAPKCAFRLLTGCDCPACGGQRALHAALHGQWLDALRFNPFLLLSVPYATAVFYTSFGKSRLAVTLKRIVQHRITVMSYVVLFFLWWILRNTPLWHNLVR